MDQQHLKLCTKCHSEKPHSDFPKDKTKKDGLYSSCWDCRREHVKQNRENILATKKKYREANREKCNEELRIYHAANKEKEKCYREENAETLRKRGAEWKRNNSQRCNEVLRKWRAAHPEKVHMQKSNRHFREKSGGGHISGEEWESLLERCGYRCLGCGRTDLKLTLDHIVPLSVGGKNSIENAQPLCRSCNSKKGTKTIDYRSSVAA